MAPPLYDALGGGSAALAAFVPTLLGLQFVRQPIIRVLTIVGVLVFVLFATSSVLAVEQSPYSVTLFIGGLALTVGMFGLIVAYTSSVSSHVPSPGP